MTKTKKIAAAAAVIAALIIAVFVFSIWSSSQAAHSAVDAYNTAAEQYNARIDTYNTAVNGIASENEELQKAMDRAETDIKQIRRRSFRTSWKKQRSSPSRCLP